MSNYLVSANDLTTISLGEQDTVTSVLQNIAVIQEAIERFEPRATYMGTTFKEAPDTPGRMLPVVEVSISA